MTSFFKTLRRLKRELDALTLTQLAIVILILSIFLILPIFSILFKAFIYEGHFSLAYFWQTFTDPEMIKIPPQWKWIVGSGFYLDEIDTALYNYKKRIRNDIIKMVFNSLIFGMIATFISGFIFFLIVFYITSHLKQISELSMKLTEEEVTPLLKLPYSANDEIGYLIHNFNIFIDESYKLIKFKKTIEEDSNLSTVYQRIINLIENEFNIDRYNLYEVNNSKNSMKLIASKGSLCCKQDILVDMTICRAARTANIVDSVDDKNICMSFTCGDYCRYICIPLIVGGNIGNVLQIVSENDEEFEIKNLNRLRKFLKEAAPVIEAKRLLEQLKESTLKDPLTGLYNRRFLDESAEMFAATALRRNTSVNMSNYNVEGELSSRWNFSYELQL